MGFFYNKKISRRLLFTSTMMDLTEFSRFRYHVWNERSCSLHCLRDMNPCKRRGRGEEIPANLNYVPVRFCSLPAPSSLDTRVSQVIDVENAYERLIPKAMENIKRSRSGISGLKIFGRLPPGDVAKWQRDWKTEKWRRLLCDHFEQNSVVLWF